MQPTEIPTADALTELVTDVLQRTSATLWDVAPSPHKPYGGAAVHATRHSDGMTLRFSVGPRTPGRFEVALVYPNTDGTSRITSSYMHFEPVTASASLDRPRDALAKDLTRRIIEPATAALAQANERIASRRAEVAAAADLEQALGAILACNPTHLAYSGTSGPADHDTAYVNLTVADRPTADVTIRGLNADQATALAQWLTTHVPRRAA